jgi:hypothetical protein
MALQEVEEVEDLLEYYLQRATAVQSEAERLLAGGWGAVAGGLRISLLQATCAYVIHWQHSMFRICPSTFLEFLACLQAAKPGPCSTIPHV